MALTYNIHDIAGIIGATAAGAALQSPVEHLLIDSRRIVFPDRSLFFALPGPRRDGHQFIEEVYGRGVRMFVVQQRYTIPQYPDAVFLSVPDVKQALHALAAYHRSRFNIPVIGITGSNGKTIVKEWLNQLLAPEHHIVRSPRSYNSQIGVPLSVWQMNDQHTLAIFEAGISLPGEMEQLTRIIQPELGILTNIGEAHSEGFLDYDHKLSEKLKLFAGCKMVIARRKEISANKEMLQQQLGTRFYTWGAAADNDFVVDDVQKDTNNSRLQIRYQSTQLRLTLPFTDEASIENAITCSCVMLMLHYQPAVIAERMAQLYPVEMRMQQKKGVNNTCIINDSYSNDPYSLSIALDYLKQQAGEGKTTVILSDFMQSVADKASLFGQVATQLEQRGVQQLIGIGPEISAHKQMMAEKFHGSILCFNGTDDLLAHLTSHHFKDEHILLKGARIFEFEKISHWLEQKVHQTVLEVNLTAMANNLRVYQQLLHPATRVMAMVKAFSYGSGSAEVARVLQFHKVDYLAVAYADEGVELRKAGISLPIMVMNPDEASFDAIIDYNLEPEMYAMHILEAWMAYVQQQGLQHFPVHLKIDTGMHRLGFEATDLDALCRVLSAQQTIAVRSVFSHLVASDAAAHDAFTRNQATLFEQACNTIQSALGYPFLKHLANSSAISRHPDLQYDMVRLGIGLYGVDSVPQIQQQLQCVASLRSTISQIKQVAAGESVGYNRSGVVNRTSRIATVRIGYADGLSRRLSNGKGSMWVAGKTAPIIGNVCMDMTMIDVTDIPAATVGSSVEIFGKHQPVQQLAGWMDTIPYEVLTGVSQRVKRVYIEE